MEFISVCLWVHYRLEVLCFLNILCPLSFGSPLVSCIHSLWQWSPTGSVDLNQTPTTHYPTFSASSRRHFSCFSLSIYTRLNIHLKAVETSAKTMLMFWLDSCCALTSGCLWCSHGAELKAMLSSSLAWYIIWNMCSSRCKEIKRANLSQHSWRPVSSASACQPVCLVPFLPFF